MKPVLSVEIPFYSTESKEKIEKCLFNVLGLVPNLVEYQTDNHSSLIGKNVPLESLEGLFSYIRKAQILDTVRECIIADSIENQITINLHKQALYIGKIAFVTVDTSSPLGNIILRIKGKNAQEILDWFAPETIDGVEIKRSNFNQILNL